MSHCTKFDFQYTDENIIKQAFTNLDLKYENSQVYSYASAYDKSIGNYNSVRQAIVAKQGGFNYFMENFGNHYELSIEKHNMNRSEEKIAKEMLDQFRHEYIRIVAEQVVDNMLIQGRNAMLSQTEKGFLINFGSTYEKSILIKFDNGRVIEEVRGVKGSSCVSLTEALENLLSSSDVELQSEWTSEYYESPEDGLFLYELDQN